MSVTGCRIAWRCGCRRRFHFLPFSVRDSEIQRIGDVDGAPLDVVEWYRQELGITVPSLEGPLRDLKKMKHRLRFYHELGVSSIEFGELVSQAPEIMEIEHTVDVRENLTYLLSLGLSSFLMCNVIATAPIVLKLSTEAHLKPRVAFYIEELNFSAEQMLKLFEECPEFLQYSIIKDIRQRIAYFRETGLKDEELSKHVILECPQVLGSTFRAEMIPRMEHISSATSKHCLHQILIHFPHAMLLPMDKTLKPFVKYFLEEVRMGRRLLAQMLENHPQVLTAEVDKDIRPKVEYLKGRGLDQLQVFRAIVHRPQILKRSLREGLIKKIDELISMGIPSEIVSTMIVKTPRYFA